MLISKGQNVHIWRYTIPEWADVLFHMLHSFHSVQHAFPRRRLQDCMKATLGVTFSTGGIEMALRMGDALGMSIGGPIPWSVRRKVFTSARVVAHPSSLWGSAGC